MATTGVENPFFLGNLPPTSSFHMAKQLSPLTSAFSHVGCVLSVTNIFLPLGIGWDTTAGFFLLKGAVLNLRQYVHFPLTGHINTVVFPPLLFSVLV